MHGRRDACHRQKYYGRRVRVLHVCARPDRADTGCFASQKTRRIVIDRVRKDSEHAKEHGVVLLALLVLLVLGLIGGAFFFVKHAQDKKSVSTTAAEVAEAGGEALSRNAQNVQRRNDALTLLAG